MHIQLKNAHSITIKEAEDIYSIMQQILKREHKIDRTKEHFWTISLNIAQKILSIELVTMGSSHAVVTEPTEVFSIPLQKKAYSIILIHNHPSGNLMPSAKDLDVTDRLIQVGIMMKTPVQDHVIITEHSYYSFANNGLMQELERSTRYVPTFELEERYKKEMTKMLQEAAIQQREVRKESRQEGLQQGEAKGLEKGAKQEKTAIARQMLQEGLEEKLISRLTGMSVQQIGRLKSSID
jgi:DNA repair protein RadC